MASHIGAFNGNLRIQRILHMQRRGRCCRGDSQGAPSLKRKQRDIAAVINAQGILRGVSHSVITEAHGWTQGAAPFKEADAIAKSISGRAGAKIEQVGRPRSRGN